MELRNLIFLLLFAQVGCISSKKIVYLQNENFKNEAPTQYNRDRENYRVQPFDILNVTIRSTDNQAADYFNMQSSVDQQLNFLGDASLFISGYSVSENGEITMPILGSIQVKDKKVEEIRMLLQNSLSKYLKDAVVNVKLVSFKISVLGEVNNPGQHRVNNEQSTILEALSIAGDLNDFANRKKIKLIRQNSEGTEIVLLDLTRPEFVQSKYFYVYPNDVIYAEPRKGVGLRRNLGLIGATAGVVSTLILLFDFLGITLKK